VFDILFYLLFILLIFYHYRLDVSLIENIQDYEEKTLNSCKREGRQVILDLFVPIYFLSSIH
jgi:hypothetical protein